MHTVVVDPRTDPRWRRLVESAPEATIFHHPAWADLLVRAYRYPVAAVVALDGGEPAAGLPIAAIASRLTGRRLVALPFSDACPPLTATGATADAIDALAQPLVRERDRRRATLEVRGAMPSIGTPVERFVTHELDLAGGRAAVEQRYRSRVRRHVRTARRSGVSTVRRTDAEALRAFYGLHLRTRRRLGVPTQPWSYVRRLERLFDARLGHIRLALIDGRPVAAAVFLRTGATLTYKYGASHEEHLAARPNNALFADEIEDACAAGLRRLDFGRSDAHQAGLRAFKAGWGAVESPLVYTYDAAPALPARESAARTALAHVIRRGPVPVGRAVGQLLYRHAG